jgi:hypothetical protein
MDTGRVGCHSAVHCRPQPVRDSYPNCVSYPGIEVFNLLSLNQRAEMHIAYTEGRAETTRISEHILLTCGGAANPRDLVRASFVCSSSYISRLWTESCRASRFMDTGMVA